MTDLTPKTWKVEIDGQAYYATGKLGIDAVLIVLERLKLNYRATKFKVTPVEQPKPATACLHIRRVR